MASVGKILLESHIQTQSDSRSRRNRSEIIYFDITILDMGAVIHQPTYGG